MGSNTSKTISVPSGTSYIRATINANNIDTYMVEKGQKINSYAPYGSAIELCKIGNYQDKFLRSNGTNLAPNNLSSETYNSLQITNNNNGTFTLLGNPTGSFGRDIATNLTLKAGTYTISANEMPSGLYIALDNTAETQLSNGTLSKTFTLASDTTYTSLGIWFTKNKDYDVTIKLMINEGSSASEWQPMNGWYLHKEIGKVTYNGTENWMTFAIDYEYQIIVQDAKEGDFENQFFPSLCNKYVNHNVGGASLNNYEFSNFTSGVYRWIRIRHNDITTLANYKTWLASNTPTFYYLLSYPTSEGIPSNLINQIEQFYQAQSKNNQTNISQINNDLAFTLNISALKRGE